MRDIKFRAWHNESKEYCEGSTSNMFAWSEEGQDVTLEQYTGLKDKNGVECYEGDIVQMYYQPMHEFGHKKSITTKFKSTGRNEYTSIGEMLDTRVVKWIGGALMLWCDNGATGHMRSFNNLANTGESFEIIGNIHQKPELLEGKK